MGQTNAKYIAMVLAHLLERATYHAKLAEEPTRSSRERAVRTALAVETATSYNYVLRTVGHIVAAERDIPFAEFLQARILHSHRKQRDAVKMLDDAGLKAILEEAYGLSKETLEADEQEKNLELKAALIIAQGQSPAVKNAIKTLARYKQLYRLQDILRQPELASRINEEAREARQEEEQRRMRIKNASFFSDVTNGLSKDLMQEAKASIEDKEAKEEKIVEDILDFLEK